MPSTITIEAGCIHIDKLTWSYRWDDADGFHEIVFTSLTTPKIGDSIIDGYLYPQDGYKINQDKSKWFRNQEPDSY